MRHLCTLFLLAVGLHALSQTHVFIAEADSALPRKWQGGNKVDKQALGTRIAEVRNNLIAHGHLEASCDCCSYRADTTRCFFHLGPQYRWARLAPGNMPAEIASAAGFRERLYRDRPITPRQMAKLFEGLLEQCENNGSPFAQVWLDSIQGREDGFEAVVDLDRGPYITIDSVVNRGTAQVNDRYLQAHIGIRPGDPYNESLIMALDQRIKELAFVSSSQRPYVFFTPDHTKLFLFLNAKSASSFNGILGIAPDASTGKVKLTGDVDLKLRNAMHHGEAIDLSWRSLQDRTQDLRLRFNYPFAFNTPFGTDLGLSLFKRDTTFLEVNARAALEYLLPRGDKVSVFINNKSSQRLGLQLVPVPGLADVKLLSYGLGLFRERFDYRFNPRKGFSMDLEGSIGKKSSSTATFSDTVRTVQHTVQLDLNGHLAWHIPLGRKSTLRLAAQGGSMMNTGSSDGSPLLYTNELYRIGGIKSMRGVDEASIYASSFTIGTVEYRYLFEENGNVFLFVDQGWWEDLSQPEPLSDTPLGFGVGTSFETKAGIFSLSYALGKQFDNPIEIRDGKVHFGFTSLF